MYLLVLGVVEYVMEYFVMIEIFFDSLDYNWLFLGFYDDWMWWLMVLVV